MRLFPVALEDFFRSARPEAEAFNKKGKLTPYRSEWNSFNLFKPIYKEELATFLKYSLQDSIALLEALIEAQQIYIKN